MLKDLKISVKTSIIVSFVLIIGFLILWKIVDQKSSDMVDNMITNQMMDAVESRATIINNYVSSAEEYMIAFSESDEVREVLRTKGDKKAVKKAQKYTENFAAVKGIFEGLYIGSPETYIYTHTSEAVVGIRTRSDEELPAFQEQMFVEGKLTNLGIMKSRGTGQMCISMYYPIFENGECIGYVGSAVFADKLMESLIALDIKGLPDSEYVFLNVETGEYLYNEDEELLCTVTEDKGYLEILSKLKNSDAPQVGMEEYVDSNNKEQIIVYRYIPERNWVFAIKDTKDNVYSSLTDIKKTTGYTCVAIAVAVLLILLIVLSSIGRKLTLISSSIDKLGNMDLTADKGLKQYSGQKDEIGIICNALNKTCGNLNSYIGEVDAQLSTMASGDFSKSSSMEFAGEFNKLKISMDRIQVALRQSFSEIGTVSSELVVGSQSVADSASRLANAAGKSSILVSEIDQHVNDISENVSMSAKLAEDARVESMEASELVKESHAKMEALSKAMSEISLATDAISGISNNLEGISKQTNILALNALVEANRAGDAGNGFAVVANEIRLLAEQSNDAALRSYDIIKETIARVNDGIRIGEETAKCLEKVVSQTNTIDESVGQIAEVTRVQNERLLGIRERLHDIGKTVEITAEMSQQSAAASVELDGQTNVLRQNICQYRV